MINSEFQNQQEVVETSELVKPNDVAVDEGLKSIDSIEPKKTNDVTKEGLQNVTPEMIKEPPFEGSWSGYSIRGTFKNVNYEWRFNGLPNAIGIRGIQNGFIITELGKEFDKLSGGKLQGIDKDKPCVGFVNKDGEGLLLYTTTEGKTKFASLPILNSLDDGPEEIPEKTNDVTKEGLQNVTPEMIKEPPFEGSWSGYSIRGTFKNVNYEWNFYDLPNATGIRGIQNGFIITELGKEIDKQYPGKLLFIDKNKPCVGFVDKDGEGLLLYTTTKGETEFTIIPIHPLRK